MEGIFDDFFFNVAVCRDEAAKILEVVHLL